MNPRVLKVFVISVLNYCEVLGIYSGISGKDYALMPPVFSFENYEQCMQLESKALYCYASIQIKPFDLKNASKVWNIIQNASSEPLNYRHDILRRGICLSLECRNFNETFVLYNKNKDFMKRVTEECFNEKIIINNFKGSVLDIHCETKERYYKFDDYDFLIGGLFLFYIIFVIIATAYEGAIKSISMKECDEYISSLKKLVSCFSLRKNWYRLTTVTSNQASKSLCAIQGVRFFNLVALMFGHTAMAAFAYPVSNTLYVEESTTKFLNVIVNNGILITQTFFVISGILLSYYFFLIMETYKNMNSFKFSVMIFIHRYIRLTPCLLVMVALGSSWAYHIGDGPIWDFVMGKVYRRCRYNWWTNLLYVNNYIHADETCMQHTWYLAVDTQLFIIGLLLLMLMWKFQRKLKIILFVSLIIAAIIPGLVSYIYKYDLVFQPFPELTQQWFINLPQYHHMHISAYSNGGTYLIGMAYGYAIYKFRGKTTNYSQSTVLTLLWWIITWLLPLSMILMGAIVYQKWYTYSRIGAAIYASVSKNLFALGVGLGILGGALNFGWYVRWLLQWRPLRILGRLTYCTYLCHLTLIKMRYGSMRSPLYHTDLLLVYHAAGDIIVAYLAGTLLCLFVEMPCSALQKLLISDVAKQKKIEMCNEKFTAPLTIVQHDNGKFRITDWK